MKEPKVQCYQEIKPTNYQYLLDSFGLMGWVICLIAFDEYYYLEKKKEKKMKKGLILLYIYFYNFNLSMHSMDTS